MVLPCRPAAQKLARTAEDLLHQRRAQLAAAAQRAARHPRAYTRRRLAASDGIPRRCRQHFPPQPRPTGHHHRLTLPRVTIRPTECSRHPLSHLLGRTRQLPHSGSLSRFPPRRHLQPHPFARVHPLRTTSRTVPRRGLPPRQGMADHRPRHYHRL